MGFWNQDLRLGCVQYASYPGADGKALVDAVTRLCTDVMFEVLEITRISDYDTRKEIKRILDVSEMTVVFSGGPVYINEQIQLGSLDRSVRQDSLDKAKRLANEAIEMGAIIHLVGSGSDPGEKYRMAALPYLAESLVILCDYIKVNAPGSMLVSMEPFDREVTYRALVGPTDDAVLVAKEVKKCVDNFGLTFDLSHLAQLGEEPSISVKEAASYIVHAHLANCYLQDATHPSYGDKHVRFGFPGSSVNEEIIADFLESMYRNGLFKKGRIPVSIEVKPQPGEEPDIVLSAAKRSFLRAWQVYELRRK